MLCLMCLIPVVKRALIVRFLEPEVLFSFQKASSVFVESQEEMEL